jgi:hypothetical protein
MRCCSVPIGIFCAWVSSQPPHVGDDWKGERGDSKWDAVEHGLTIEVKRDSFGHVLLTFVLRESYLPNTWSVPATVKIEPGEEMSQLASAIERLIPPP